MLIGDAAHTAHFPSVREQNWDWRMRSLWHTTSTAVNPWRRAKSIRKNAKLMCCDFKIVRVTP
ncbi:MAG: hypothetical protein CM15mP74_09600 [Halieaceae bacterium]|nr:MAG: hypothetical protein CM15mP74_09600 [Halieaceae bacterium]